jgi:peptidyl-prolyl cis-trans isomerase SurA
MKKLRQFIFAASCLALTPFTASSEEVSLDRVAAIVNSGVVLQSEVESLLENVRLEAKRSGQALPSDNALRTQAMEKLINDSLMVQLGERMGVQVSDAQLDDTITNMAKDSQLNLEQFRAKIISEGLDWEKYRENLRTELITGEVRRASVRRRVFVTPQEVDSLVKLMQEQSNANVEYQLGHILIEFPNNASQSDMTAAKERAEKVIELLNTGSDFKKIAIASSGASNALEGGVLDWMGINEMPTLFSEVIQDKEQGAIVGPIRTGLGYSIVKIFEIRGKQVVETTEVKSRHILIKPTIILSEAKAESMLQGFLEQINAGEADFAELAREHSDGPTSTRGGDLGWADPNTYDPAFKKALQNLDIGEYHPPFRSSFGWHLVQLTDRRTLDATTTANTNRAYQILFNRKFGMENARWIKQIRDEAYIEIFDIDASDG